MKFLGFGEQVLVIGNRFEGFRDFGGSVRQERERSRRNGREPKKVAPIGVERADRVSIHRGIVRFRTVSSISRSSKEKSPSFRTGIFRGLFLDGSGLLLASVELVDRGGLEDALFTGVERVAFVAGFYLDFVAEGALGSEGVTAGASNGDVVERRVDVLLHMKGVG